MAITTDTTQELNWDNLGKTGQDFIDYLKPPKHFTFRVVNHAEWDKPTVNFLYPNHTSRLHINRAFFVDLSQVHAEYALLHQIYFFAAQGLLMPNFMTYIEDHKLGDFVQLAAVNAHTAVIGYMYRHNLIESFDHYLEIKYSVRRKHSGDRLRGVSLEKFLGSLISVKLALDGSSDAMYLPLLRCDVTIFIRLRRNGGLSFGLTGPVLIDKLDWQRLFFTPYVTTKEEFISSANQLTSDLLYIISKL